VWCSGGGSSRNGTLHCILFTVDHIIFKKGEYDTVVVVVVMVMMMMVMMIIILRS
jgi:uncharacterized membrane protein